MRIALIDSVIINKYNAVFDNEHLSHGKICVEILKKYAPTAEVIIFEVLSLLGVGSIDKLCSALNQCLEQKIMIINLSLGSQYLSDIPQLKQIINKLILNGHLIVSANANNGYISFPSSFAGVINVSCSKDTKNDAWSYNNDYIGKRNSFASGVYSLTCDNGKSFMTDANNSYAAPFITATLHNYLSSNKTDSFYIHSIKFLTKKKLYFPESRPDFTSKCTVIDLENKLEVSMLSINVLKLYSGDEIYNFIALERCCIVIIDSLLLDFDRLISQLSKQIQNISSVLFTDYLPPNFQRYICKNNLIYWAKSKGNGLSLLANHKINIPIISITSKDNYVISYAKRLSEKLRTIGYDGLVYSNLNYSYLYGVEYVCSEMNTISNLSFEISKYKNISLAIFVSESANNLNFDLNIEITNNTSAKCYSGNELTAMLHFQNDELLDEVAKLIENFFS